MENKEEIREVNAHIRAALNQWANICVMSDAENWSANYEYDDDDVFNVALIFNHVMGNVGIKRGVLNEKNANDFGQEFRDFILKYTDFDTFTFNFSKKNNESETAS
jgi:hypothetical protein